MKKAASLLVTLLLGGASGLAHAQEKPPAGPPNASVYAGDCLNPALNGALGAAEAAEAANESAVLAGLFSAIAPKLIGAGLDFIGAKLAALGEEQKTPIRGARNTQSPLTTRYCVQIIKWADPGAAASPTLKDLLARDFAKNAAPLPLLAQSQAPADFVLEFWVRPSQSGKAISLTPSLLYYPKQFASKNGKDVTLTVTASLAPYGGSATSSTWFLPKTWKTGPTVQALIAPDEENNALVRRRWGELKRLCETACDGASAWLANPWTGKAAAKGDAPALNRQVAAPVLTTPEETAFTIALEITEIREGSKFFKAVSQGYADFKPTAQGDLEKLLIRQAGDKAEDQARTTSATSLITYSTRLGEAESSRVKYCETRAKPTATIQAAAAELSAKQITANLAAKAADLSEPFPTPIPVTGVFDQTRCS